MARPIPQGAPVRSPQFGRTNTAATQAALYHARRRRVAELPADPGGPIFFPEAKVRVVSESVSVAETTPRVLAP